MSIININGRTYSGNNVSIINNRIRIDGKEIEPLEEKEINISITGNLDSLDVDSCNAITIKGNCNNVETVSGHVNVLQEIKGNVNTISGSVKSPLINGSVSTISGNIKQN